MIGDQLQTTIRSFKGRGLVTCNEYLWLPKSNFIVERSIMHANHFIIFLRFEMRTQLVDRKYGFDLCFIPLSFDIIDCRLRYRIRRFDEAFCVCTFDIWFLQLPISISLSDQRIAWGICLWMFLCCCDMQSPIALSQCKLSYNI